MGLPWCDPTFVLWNVVVEADTCLACDPGTVESLRQGAAQQPGISRGLRDAVHVLLCEVDTCALRVAVALPSEGVTDATLDPSPLERIWGALLKSDVTIRPKNT